MFKLSMFTTYAFLVYFLFNLSFINAQSMTYLALGDSYTIGEAVEQPYNWPNLLVKQLNQDGFDFQKPKIIAVTGWRTDELIDSIQKDEESLQTKYDLVSLLIGVNNQYQKKDINQYREEFKQLVEMGLRKSKNGKQGMFIVSIPDYGVSDFAKKKGLKNVSKEVKEYNAIAKQIADEYQIPFYNITPVSKTTEGNKAMFAEDELHPSSKQYQLWLDVFYEDVKKQLKPVNN